MQFFLNLKSMSKMMSKTLRVVYIGKKHGFQVPITIQIGVGSWQKMNCRPRWFYRKILLSIKKNFTDRFAIWRQNGDAAHLSNQNLKILKISLFLKVGLRTLEEKGRNEFSCLINFEERSQAHGSEYYHQSCSRIILLINKADRTL